MPTDQPRTAQTAPQTAPQTVPPAALPPVVDRAAWQAEIDALRDREKAHTRAGAPLPAGGPPPPPPRGGRAPPPRRGRPPDRIPMGRPGEPDEIAAAIVWLLSPH
ncbi:hypothetical protein AAHZ94_11905, partial [Streptomyces sp. HSW2009]